MPNALLLDILIMLMQLLPISILTIFRISIKMISSGTKMSTDFVILELNILELCSISSEQMVILIFYSHFLSLYLSQHASDIICYLSIMFSSF